MDGQPLRQEMTTDAQTGAQKAMSLDRYDLIPPKALEYLALVYGKGSLKYADRNWEKGYSWGKSFRALISHAFKAWRGEWYDKHEPTCTPSCLNHTELPHLAQVAWHAFALLTYYDLKLGTDDRSKAGVPITATEVKQRNAEAQRQQASLLQIPYIDIDKMKQWAAEPYTFGFCPECTREVESGNMKRADTKCGKGRIGKA